MPTLLELQREFLGAVLDGAVAAENRILARGMAPARRLGVYTNNARANFIEGLRLGFPVILRLVGEAYFDHCALAYRAAHPSRSGDLNAAGQAFPGFLAERHAAGDYRYLGEVARLEWLCQESLMAADHPPPDAVRFFERLAAVPPQRYDDLKFTLHSTARLFASDYPASEIWNANLADAEPKIIDLAKGGERLLLIRSPVGHPQTLEFHRLSAGEYALLSAIEARADFAAALAHAMAASDAHTAPSTAQVAAAVPGDRPSDFDAAAALQRCVAASAIVDFDLT
jgi:hypothetical protein